MPSNSSVGTPTLVARSNRGLTVRTLTYNRQVVGDVLDERVERTIYDPQGRVVSRIDPRFFTAAAAPNFVYVSTLSGQVLRSESVDAGTQCTLADVDGRPVWTHDARGTVTTWTYDALGRPLSAAEIVNGQQPAVRDVWIYGEAQPNAQTHNLRGHCVRRYDTGGRLAWSGFRLTGQPLDETRQLLADAEADANWRESDETAWASELETAQYATAWQHDATGTWVTQTDAKANVQERTFDVAGRPARSSLALAGGKSRPVLLAIDYSAAGQILNITSGNDAVGNYTYEAQTERLIGLTVTRPAQAGRATVVQDLGYEYDPVGNIVSLTDSAQAISYWRNQAIAPTLTYRYDALYQLIGATGRELANRCRQGHTLPAATIPLPNDDSLYTNYTRTYTYDRGGNLATMQHQGAANYTQAIVVSDHSNHAMQQAVTGNLKPPDIDNGSWFDEAGNQQLLMPDATQPLGWDNRNRLKRVTLVKRSGQDDDREVYQYSGDGMRVRKRTVVQVNGAARTVDAIYLSGLTLRITSSNNGKTVTVVESLQEVECETGSTHARCLHWETGLPANLANDQTRYGIGDLNGSVRQELDQQANLISREEYYPYGGTAVWSARSQVEADTKFVRYSSKERDPTGLYYYGYRYYQPWIGRWLNSDPSGTDDGLNLHRMVRNNPVTLVDLNGLISDHPEGATSVPSRIPHFIVTPFDNVEEFFNDLQSIAKHAISRKKAIPIPVFKDDAQRDAFRKIAKSKLIPTSQRKDLSGKPVADEIYHALERQSRTTLARMSLAGNENPRVYVLGHGAAGQDIIRSGQERKSALDAARILIQMGLPSRSDVRALSCYSAAGSSYKGTTQNWMSHFKAGTLAELFQTDGSYAGGLQLHLTQNMIFDGTVSGYVSKITIKPHRVISKDGEEGIHFAGASGGEQSTPTLVRRRDMRITVQNQNTPLSLRPPSPEIFRL